MENVDALLDVEVRDAKQKELSKIGKEYKEKNTLKNSLDKECKVLNTKIKDTMSELGLKNFIDGDLSVTISETDKSSLDELKVIEYLKQKKLTEFIHTKEYIDMDEILYQAQNGNIPLEDLQPFVVKNIQYSLRVK